MTNEVEVKRVIKSMLESLLPDILRQSNNSIREATVVSADAGARTISVTVANTGSVISGVKYIASATPKTNDACLLLSADPNFKGRVYALVFN